MTVLNCQAAPQMYVIKTVCPLLLDVSNHLGIGISLLYKVISRTLAELIFYVLYMSCVMRKPAICMRENKDTDQLGSNCAADQRLCFRYMDCKIPLLPKSESSSL